MKSEFQFFMHPRDESDFIRFIGPDADLSAAGDQRSAVYPRDGLQFWRGTLTDDLLTAGRIAVLSTDSGIETLYKRWRRWLRTRYSNRLFCYSEFFPATERKLVPAKSFWVGPYAHEWIGADPKHTLRQFAQGAVVFVLPERLPPSAI